MKGGNKERESNEEKKEHKINSQLLTPWCVCLCSVSALHTSCTHTVHRQMNKFSIYSTEMPQVSTFNTYTYSRRIEIYA